MSVATAVLADEAAEIYAYSGIAYTFKIDWVNLGEAPVQMGIEFTRSDGLTAGEDPVVGYCPDGFSAGTSTDTTFECLPNAGENAQKDKAPPEITPKKPNTHQPPPVCDGMMGDPCNSADGNNHQVETDYTGTGPVPLRYQRTYNSIPTGEPEYLTHPSYWRSTYDRSVAVSSITTLSTTQSNDPPPGGPIVTAAVERPNGDVYYFALENGQYVPDSDIRDILTQTSSGWTYSRPDGTVETYDTSGRLLSITNAAGLTRTLTYDPTTGFLTSVTDPFGHSLTFTHDAEGRVITMTDPNGDVYKYAYDANNNLSTVTYPDGTVKTYLYDESAEVPSGSSFPNALTGIVDQNGNRYATFGYDTSGRLVLSEHAQTTNSVGQDQYTFSYDSATQTTATDAAGNKTVLTFSTNLGVKNVIAKQVYNTSGGAVGDPLTRAFDGDNNLLCREDYAGHVTTYTYDSTNQMVSKTEGQTGDCNNYPSDVASTYATRTITYSYLSPTLDLLTAIDRPSVDSGQTFSTTITYGDSTHPELPTSITESGYTPSGTAVTRTIGMTYTASGQIATLTDPNGNTTTYSYNNCTSGGGCGELASVTNALGQTVQYNAYYADGLPQTRIDLNGTSDQYAYDTLRRLTADTTVASATRHVDYAYWPSGQIGSVSYYPLGLTVTNSYDAAQERDFVSDSLGDKTQYNHDSRGNVDAVYTYNPNGAYATIGAGHYDAFDHLASWEDFDGDITTYHNDALGNILTIIHPDQQGETSPPETQNTFDALNRLMQTADRAGGITTYDYDTNNHLTGVTTPNGADTTYVVDDLGNVLSEISPDRGTTAYTYDAAGNVLSKTDARGVVTDYSYDKLNRLTSVTYPSDSTENITYTYDSAPGCSDGIGHLCAETDETGSSSYAYDGFGHLVSDARSEGTVTYTTAYSPDPFGAIDSETYPDGRTITYTRNALDEITTITTTVNGAAQTIVSNRSFGINHHLLSQTFGNGLTETRSYDLAGRFTDQSLGSDTRVYGYDPDGNLVSLQTIPEVDCFGYDVRDELTQSTVETASGATCPPASPGTTYTYDPNGNRLSLIQGATTTAYTYTADSNRLASIGGSSVSINKIGDITVDSQGRHFLYNAAGQITEAVSAYGALGYYNYDSHNRRVNSFSSLGNLYYHYDQAGHLIEVTDGTGALIRDYIWTDHVPVAMITKDAVTGVETLTYIETDYDGTPREATDQSGNIVWRWEGAFGKRAPNPDQVNIKLRYPGQYYDEETGLFYNWNRYYDPGTGRYDQVDPLGVVPGQTPMPEAPYGLATVIRYIPLQERLPLGINQPYAYVDGDPLSYTDTLGLWTVNIGISGSVNIPLIGRVGIGGGGYGGIVCDGTQCAWYYGGGGGAGAGTGGSFGIQIGGSNAKSVCDLRGPFGSVSVSGGEGLIVGGEGYTGSGSQGQSVTGGNLFIGGGDGTPVSGNGGATYTWIKPW